MIVNLSGSARAKVNVLALACPNDECFRQWPKVVGQSTQAVLSSLAININPDNVSASTNTDIASIWQPCEHLTDTVGFRSGAVRAVLVWLLARNLERKNGQA